MPWDLDPSSPIYLQLAEEIKKQVIAGSLIPGQRLDSVRDLAAQAGVNPNTMQRALAELERENLIYSVRTSGRFVTEDKEMIDQMRKELALEQIGKLIAVLTQLGYTGPQIVQMLAEKIEEAQV